MAWKGMMAMKTKVLGWAVLVVFVSLAGTTARADFVVNIFEDGVQKGTLNAGPGVSSGTLSAFGASFGDFSITFLFSTSNSPGSQSGAGIQLGTVDVTNTSGSSHTLTIKVSAQDFTIPSGPVTLKNTLSGSVNTGTLVSADFTSYMDRTNGLFGTSDVATPTLAFGPVGANNSFSGSNDTNTTVSSSYSISEIGDWKLDGNSTLTVTGGNSSAVVPEPSSVSMLAMGGGILGAIGIYRKRRSKFV
jgi:PEP-CTERM motif-containing protein